MRIKLDHREQDPDQSISSFEQPKPGVYKGEVMAATVRFKEEGKAKDLRDIEVVIKLTEGDYAGAQLWDYPSFSEAAEWRMDQFMLATGVLTRKKRTAEWKSERELEKALKGSPVVVRVKADSYNDEYRARISQYMRPADDDDEGDTGEDVFGEDEAEGEESDVEMPESIAQVRALKIKGLRDVADELGLDHRGIKKDDLRQDVIDELELDEDSEPEEADESDGAEDAEPDEEDWTLEAVKSCTIRELRDLAGELEIEHAGVTKTKLRNLIIEEFGFEEGEDEPPF